MSWNMSEWKAEAERSAEGGCGVIGVACTVAIPGRHIIKSVAQMRNRGNGKGGGLALVGCFPNYPEHYALNIGLLDPTVRGEIERDFIQPYFDVALIELQPAVGDYGALGLEIKPPDTVRYFVRVRPDVLARHAETFRNRTDTDFKTEADAEDDFVYQNSFSLNAHFYGDRPDKRAYVLSHGRNMMILKAVGYAEDIARYYGLEDVTANVWIGHQRYPTRGRVWHPGGAHPFSGMDEALVHNGDFANFVGTSVFLKQRGYQPMFLTDTEVSVLLFDLYSRLYNYPLEFIFEALAPTTERDFVKLLPKRAAIYRQIQRSFMHASPDGPWFFIVARNAVIDARRGRIPGPAFQLVGITDTSMLRPQVFALQEAETASTAVIASERQAIDAVFQSLAGDDPRFCPMPDKVWVARGGSHSDGGAFVFSVFGKDGKTWLECTDKFGTPIVTDRKQRHVDLPNSASAASQLLAKSNPGEELDGLFAQIMTAIPTCRFADLQAMCAEIVDQSRQSPAHRHKALAMLTLLNDRRYPTGDKKRGAILAIVQSALTNLCAKVPGFGTTTADPDRRVDFDSREMIAPCSDPSGCLFVDAHNFPPEGDESAARAIVAGCQAGWKHFVVYNCKGDRFLGCGLGPRSYGVRIDVYGSSGDYLGSGLHGAEIHVHGDAQDQVGQIVTDGKIVIHGNAGQTLLYGAKGGSVYVLGNAAGRPLINAVGRIRAIINGTCLDYCAESFMAGADIGGGFVCINGLAYDERGELHRLAEPYPGGNFFSLASGGAGYVADPHRMMDQAQLNGAEFLPFTRDDWDVLKPHLEENARLFGLTADLVMNVDERQVSPGELYRKVARVPKRFQGNQLGT
jgi:glutamate synthase domain-containing protein 1/glutamate synthase domain-containing protein 3